MTQNTLGHRLRAARQAIIPSPTLQDVAQKMQLSRSAIHLWEAGKTMPNPVQLAELAKLYNVTANWLLGLSERHKAVTSDAVDLVNIPLIPIVRAEDMARWHEEAATGFVQTALTYPPHTALAFPVTSDAINSICPVGSLAVVSKGHAPTHGSIVLALIGSSKEPVLRKLIREGGEDLLVADDTRYSTHKLGENARIIGVVTEVIHRKTLV